MAMLKKLAVSLLACSLLFSSAAYAGNGQEDNSSRQTSHDREWLEKALHRVKDPKLREELKRALEKWKEQENEGKKAKTASQIVAADKKRLTIIYNGGNDDKNVTLPLTLPTQGKYGSTITWTSSHPGVISHDGKTVNRPTVQTGDVKVTLKAVISKHNVKDTKTFTVVVRCLWTDAQRVAVDKAALTVGFSGKDNANRVTSKLKLPVAGKNGSTVTWMSSAPNIISHDGKTVNRPAGGQGDASVTLTATIRSNNVVDTKTFTVIVKEHYNDLQKVSADKAALDIGFREGDSANRVTSSLKLPSVGPFGSKIVWISSNASIVSSDGKTVKRPTADQGDAAVTLFAVISSNAITDIKPFPIVVKQQWNDTEKVSLDKAALSISFSGDDSAGSVTRKVKLPAAGPNGSKITWISSAPSVVSADGTVNRPAAGQGDATVNLIATITSNNVSDTKVFTVVVKQQLTDEQKVSADKAALSIGFSGNDNGSNVTSNLKLPAAGVNGSTVLWFSSNTQIVSENGKVTRPSAGSGDKTVTLTAVLINNSAVDWKEFIITVKQKQ